MWAHLGLPSPTPLQLSVADTLQYGPKRLIVSGFRGLGKSWLTQGFVIWNLLLDPDKKILVVSASQPLADAFSTFVKSLIKSWDIVSHLAPKADQRDSNLAFDVGPARPDPAPSVKSAGITGQITGSRADIIVADDIEIPKNSITHTMREKLAELVKEFDAILKPESQSPDSRIVYLGTPQVEQTIYKRLEGRGYVTRVWPAEIPKELDIYRGRLAPYISKLIAEGATAGTPTEPLRFPETDLLERRLSYGRTGYALQYMLDTSPSDAEATPLKCRDLIVIPCDDKMAPAKIAWGNDRELAVDDLPCVGYDGDAFFRPAWKSGEMTDYTGCVMAIDPSGKGKDETAYSIVRICMGTLFWVDCGGFLDGFSEKTLETLAQRAKRFGVNYVIAEENFGGGMFNSLLKPYLVKYGAGTFDPDWKGWSKGQKEQRICDILQPAFEQHRIVVDRGLIERDLMLAERDTAYSVMYQMTRLKREKGCLAHDDRIESLSMAVAYWTEKLAKDRNEAYKDHQEELLEQQRESFIESAMNLWGPPKDKEFVLWTRA